MMGSYPQFLLFGDSLLERSSHLIDGFSLSAALQSHYIRRMDVINRGLSGYNTAQALEVLPRIIPPVSSAHVEFLLILFGANDACIAEAPTKQHVPLQTYKQNLKALITHPMVLAHHPKIILCTPPPIDEVRQEEIDASKGYPLCRRVEVTAKYAEAVRQVGAEVGGNLVVLDLWSEVVDEVQDRTTNHNPDGPIVGTKQLGSNKALTHLMPDGLHFGSAGYSKFFKVLLSTLEHKWPDSFQYIFPEWQVAPRAQ